MSLKLSIKDARYFSVWQVILKNDIFFWQLILIRPIKANNSDGFYLFNKVLHFSAVGGAVTFEEDTREHL